MHIVVTLAGHSRRFRAAGYDLPKFLLPVAGAPMIQRVVEMFGADDHFHFVINADQEAQHPELRPLLASLAARTSVVIVTPHDKGPVYSALQVSGIPDDEPVIVTYCDFTVNWDYRQFRRHVEGHAGGIPSFRGFHPASFGDTYYAYLRVDGDRMLELREKASFTDDRTSEPASTGVYYFDRWGTFRAYGARRLERHAGDASEAYVSLLFNDMVADGLDVIVHDVEHFICLGTPRDYQQHEFWWRYFSEDQEDWQAGTATNTVNLLPMAGRGSRFREYGYRLAKPLIPVQRDPMAIRALRSLPPADSWVFLLNQDDLRKHPIEPMLKRFAPEAVTLPVEKLTSGQAATCLLAKAHLPPDSGVMIASCDYEHRYDPAAWNAILDDPTIDGAIWTYRMRSLPMKAPTAFAWCRVRADGRTVEEVVEKRAISDTPGEDPLAIGTFWYRRASDFVRGAETMIDRGITVNGEHYVGTSINGLIQEGLRFVIFEVVQWVPFGDPFELKMLEYWEDYFAAAGRRRGLDATPFATVS
jgi:NDP-sugar pyrophosphorylase family protein